MCLQVNPLVVSQTSNLDHETLLSLYLYFGHDALYYFDNFILTF
jgi:hypothetical protein